MKMPKKGEILSRAEVIRGILQPTGATYFLVYLAEDSIAFAVGTRQCAFDPVVEKLFGQWDDVAEVIWHFDGQRQILRVNFGAKKWSEV